MAYLNVRERRIETKIAYVGPALSGKATNLEHLKSDSARGRVSDVRATSVEGNELVSLEWTPLRMPRFNDCDVAVKLVATRGALSTSRLDDLFEDVDGVIVVFDAAPAAQEENRRALGLVREALAKETSTPRPVVVQLNKSDVPGALSPSDLAGQLGTEHWPVVSASASRGEGVYETLEIALTSVIDAMKTKEADAPEVKADHNPLLTALRQILRDTVTEHMATLEATTIARVTAAISSAPERSDAALVARLDRTDRALEELRATVASIYGSITALAKDDARAAQERSISELGVMAQHAQAALAKIGSSVRETSDRLAELQAASSELCNRDDLAGVEARIRDEVTTRGKGDREHLASVAAVLRRTVEAVALDLKKQDLRDALSTLASDIERLHGKTDGLRAELVPGAIVASGLPSRLVALETMIQRELKDSFTPRLARLDDSVQGLQAESGESFTRAEARVVEIQAGLTELLDELKKRKKGWFS